MKKFLLGLIVTLTAIGIFSPSSEERLAKDASDKGITVEQLIKDRQLEELSKINAVKEKCLSQDKLSCEEYLELVYNMDAREVLWDSLYLHQDHFMKNHVYNKKKNLNVWFNKESLTFHSGFVYEVKNATNGGVRKVTVYARMKADDNKIEVSDDTGMFYNGYYEIKDGKVTL